jgi:acylphosphatase
MACPSCAEKAVQENKTARRYFVTGTVQGVGYRYFAQRAARHLGLAGFVRNLGDGRVEVYAVGLAESLEKLKRELQQGPSGAQVTSVLEGVMERAREEDAAIERRSADGFSIEYDN